MGHRPRGVRLLERGHGHRCGRRQRSAGTRRRPPPSWRSSPRACGGATPPRWPRWHRRRRRLDAAGLSLPERVPADRRVRRVGALLPVALLAALVATQTFATGHDLTVDARAGGLAVAGVAVLATAPFLVVIVAAAGATALVRAIS
ncbi:MAG TPA: AzlD domain-containing protein [Gaiellales bacterium]|nr:AzlD domain-containing protein [Gaiellales bacterium]